MIINRPTPNDSGKYTITAENKLKKTEMTHIVEFQGKDYHIAHNMHRAYHVDHNRVKESITREADGEEASEKKGKDKKKEKEKERKGKAGLPPKQTMFFAANLIDRVIAEGSKVRLSCYVHGPDPQIKWTKNDIPVAYGPKVKNLSKDGMGALEFLSAKIDDSGVYKCIARNANGEVSSQATLTVYKNDKNVDVPPTFTRAVKGCLSNLKIYLNFN